MRFLMLYTKGKEKEEASAEDTSSLLFGKRLLGEPLAGLHLCHANTVFNALQLFA